MLKIKSFLIAATAIALLTAGTTVPPSPVTQPHPSVALAPVPRKAPKLACGPTLWLCSIPGWKLPSPVSTGSFHH